MQNFGSIADRWHSRYGTWDENRPAGLRTYMLVCVGSCLIMLTNQYTYQLTGIGDPVRLGAQVVSGIGFLGAGTIVVTRRNHLVLIEDVRKIKGVIYLEEL